MKAALAQLLDLEPSGFRTTGETRGFRGARQWLSDMMEGGASAAIIQKSASSPGNHENPREPWDFGWREFMRLIGQVKA